MIVMNEHDWIMARHDESDTGIVSAGGFFVEHGPDLQAVPHELSAPTLVNPPIPSEMILRRVDEIATLIERDYYGRSPLLVPILNGACVFATDLLRKLSRLAPRFEPILARSYDGTHAQRVRIDHGMLDRIPLAGQHVLVIDDIVDTGQTLTEVTRLIADRRPASLATCVFLDKLRVDPEGKPRRPFPFSPTYVGFQIPDVFVVGYGLDHDGAFRDLPMIQPLPAIEPRQSEDEGILVTLGGRRDERPTALPLPWIELKNLGPEPIEDAHVTIELCAERGWSEIESIADDGFIRKPAASITTPVWNVGQTLTEKLDTGGFDETLARIELSLNARIAGEVLLARNPMTRGMILQGARRDTAHPESDFSYQNRWLIPTASSSADSKN
jgi:hypoxanthine phosphoribosyltransferase